MKKISPIKLGLLVICPLLAVMVLTWTTVIFILTDRDLPFLASDHKKQTETKVEAVKTDGKDNTMSKPTENPVETAENKAEAASGSEAATANAAEKTAVASKEEPEESAAPQETAAQTSAPDAAQETLVAEEEASRIINLISEINKIKTEAGKSPN